MESVPRIEPSAPRAPAPAMSRRAAVFALGSLSAAVLAACGGAPSASPALPRGDAAAPPPVDEDTEPRHLNLPPRPSNAPSASAFLARAGRMTAGEREHAILAEIVAGNVPSFERALKSVRVTIPRDSGLRSAHVRVVADYLAIGSDDDFIRMPMTARTAQRVADAAACVLPTRKLVDEIYRAASVKLTSPTFAAGDEMTSSGYFEAHERAIEERRHRLGARLGDLTAGHKKDVVISARLRVSPGRLAIYGWFRDDGHAIQPLSTIHDDKYVDYAHGVRLVDRVMLLDGKPRDLVEVLRDPELCAVLSDEGVVDPAGYAVRGNG